MRKTKYCLGSGGSDRVIINRSKFGLVKNDYFISDVNVAQVIESIGKPNFGLSENKVQPNFGLNENMPQPIENIRNPKNRVSDYFISDVNVAQVIESIGKLKNQPVKNGAQVIENKAQSNFTFNGFFIEATY